MKVNGLIKLKTSSATNTTLLSSFSAEDTTDFVMHVCLNKLKYFKYENEGNVLKTNVMEELYAKKNCNYLP